MEDDVEKLQSLIKERNENIVQFNFENNTSSPIAITLFDTASLTTQPTSGSQVSTYTSSNDLLPTLEKSSYLSFNPTNNKILAGSKDSNSFRIIDSSTNTTLNNYTNSTFNGTIYKVLRQSDGKLVCIGQFSFYGGLSNNQIIRLNSDGTKDNSFDNSIGFAGGIALISAIQSDGKILVGGGFTSYKGVTANKIIRLNSDGTKDTSFDNSIGFDFAVQSIEIQSDGKIVLAGNFTTYKGVSANGIIRLNSDGTKDTSFDNSVGFDSFCRSLQIQSDGKILVGGNFTTYKGVSANRIIRLNSDGTKDTSFDNSIGFNNSVEALALQSDGKILVGGNFTTYKGVSANRIIRLNSDGTKDTSFDNSIGYDNLVNEIVVQSDGKIFVGGAFTTYKSTNAQQINRLNSNGTIDSSFDALTGFQGGLIESILVNTDGSIFVGGVFTTYRNWQCLFFTKLESNGNLSTILQVQGVGLPSDIQYCPSNDSFYCSVANAGYLIQISGDGQSILQNFITLPVATQRTYSSTYNATYDYMYYLTKDSTLSKSEILVLDCATNTFVTTILLANNFFYSPALSQVTTNDDIYVFDILNSYVQKINCSTNTLVLINVSLPNVNNYAKSLQYNATNNSLYVISDLYSVIDVVDTSTDTYSSSITIPASYTFAPLYSALNTNTNQIFITDANENASQYAVIDCSNNNSVSVQSLSSTSAETFDVLYNNTTNTMYISGSLYSIVTFTATPFFIGGSTNYNTFVNSLNFEPIFVDEIRILSLTLQQLSNQLQFAKIDSNGNQVFFPEFPINKIDVDQNNNIAEIMLNGMVFDGRTYINQYVINPNEVVSFEVIYRQVDRLSATKTYPIFFKEKVSLKEYINKNYTDFIEL